MSHKNNNSHKHIKQTFKSSGELHGKQRHRQLAAVIRLATTQVRFLNVKVVKVDVGSVVAYTESVDDTTWRTGNQLVKQQVCQQEMTWDIKGISKRFYLGLPSTAATTTTATNPVKYNLSLFIVASVQMLFQG